ncbi:MAG: type II toxin-antitoxin system RelE/ParE family toxin [Burkholderiales bacterium]|nr:type II toxin-antitoxin system RelE/ParE family toxin [Burkholderiales bacterium]MDR4518593.1 type II toxin-antitoxin system RelE/ParE family toxin [Nitrosomonas sp.]
MVVWTDSATSDLRAVHDYIAKDSLYYAKKVVNDVRERMEQLDTFPKIGRIVPEINQENIREISIYSYRIIYEINDQVIIVLAIVHQRQVLNNEI